VSYKLDYIGQRVHAQVYGALHLAACILAFTLLPAGAPVYLALVAAEVVLLVLAMRTCLRHWRIPEYTLFWRHATSW
jgi:urea transporter